MKSSVIIYLILIAAIAALFYISIVTKEDFSESAKWFWSGIVAILQVGISAAIIEGNKEDEK